MTELFDNVVGALMFLAIILLLLWLHLIQRKD